MKNSRRSIRVLCVLLAFIFCACGSQIEEVPDLALTETMPKTEEEREYPYFETELFFAAADGRKLVPEMRRIIMTADEAYTEMAIRTLFDGASTQSQQAVLQRGMKFEKVEASTDVCNVYITGEVTLDEKQWLLARAAVAATVNAVDGTPSVNMYYNQMEPGYLGRPLGALAPIVENLDVYIRNLELEYEALKKEREENTEDNSFEIRSATLYFANAEDSLLQTQNSTISYAARATKEEIARIILDALKKPLDNEQGLQSALPADFRLLSVQFVPLSGETPEEDAAAANETMEEPDESILELIMEKPKSDYDKEKMCGAITMALTGFIPKLRGVHILTQDESGTLLNICADGVYTRDMFSERIGHTIVLHYPENDGAGFYSLNYTVAGEGSYAPIVRLQALLDHKTAQKQLFPGVDSGDIQNVYISGNTAVVDWKRGFGAKLKALQEDETSVLPKERRVWLFVYSVINTMTEFPGVRSVWMLEDGQKLGTQGEVYLGNALMRNPGIVLREGEE